MTRDKQVRDAIALANERRAMYDPQQVRDLIAAADAILSNSGPHNDAEHRLINRADKLRIFEPATPVLPTPFDARIDETRASRDAALARRDSKIEALQSAIGQFNRARNANDQAALAAIEQARGEIEDADEACTRLSARLVALEVTRDRWRWQQSVRTR